MSVAPRDASVDVRCELRASEGCRDVYAVSLRAEQKNRARNAGAFICLPCSRRAKFSGRANPNCHHLDLADDWLHVIDTEEKAYFLGWIAGDGSVSAGTIQIALDAADLGTLTKLRDLWCPSVPVRPKKNTSLWCAAFHSQEAVRDVCRHLGIGPGDKHLTVSPPELREQRLQQAFFRGLFDADGCVVSPFTKGNSPRCSLASSSLAMIAAFEAFVGVSGYPSDGGMEWSGNNALDALSRLYDGARHDLALPRKRERYWEWSAWVPGLTVPRAGSSLEIEVFKTRPDAVWPKKERATDSGYDLTVLEESRRFGDVVLYATGIKVRPGYGWYFDLVPRSSIIKSGYMLAHSVGVIDRSYTGEVFVPLVKVDPNAPDLELPCRIAQLVPRPIVHAQIIERSEPFDSSARGEGGFGSTGRR